MSNPKIVKLSAGQKAPNIITNDVMGKPINLRRMQSRYILLVFFRYSGCAWCNLAIHRLSLEYATLKENDCEVITFIQSEKKAITKNIYERHAHRPEFSIVADPHLQFYNLYGVTRSARAVLKSIKNVPHWLHSVKQYGFKQTSVDGNLFIVPASVLIDGRTGIVLKSRYGASFYDADAFLDIYSSVFFKEL